MALLTRSRRERRWAALIGVVALLTGLVVVALPSSANPGIANLDFAADGFIQRQGSLQDWSDNPTTSTLTGMLTGLGTRAAACQTGVTGSNPELICDDVKSDSDTFPGGAKESDPSGWIPYQFGQVTPKTDITNIYAGGQVITTGSVPVLLSGMERLPKAGDVHLDFEYNKQMTGTGNNQIPARQQNDILVAYDLGGSRNSNENAVSVRIYKAKANGTYDYANPDFSQSGAGGIDTSATVAQINDSTINCGVPWGCYDAGGALLTGNSATLPAFSFFEAAIDLKASVGLSEACFNFVTVKSRSSESVTSQLKDTTKPRSFPFCGGLTVNKYIDVNHNGTRDVGADVTTGTAVANWSFTVQGPAPSTATVCSGVTTATTGNLVCSTGGLDTLTPGNYTVTETQKTGFYNTDPGSFSTTTVSKQNVAVSLGAPATAYFGNDCYVAKTFRITNVPSGTTGMFADWTIASGPHANTTGTVTLNVSGSEATGTVSNTFTAGNAITWVWGTNNNHANTQAGRTNESLASAGYPTCANTNTVQFPFATLTGHKFKDANHDGVETGSEGPPAVPFTFQLRTTSGTVLQTTTSSVATGDYSFSNVTPGTYVVHEVPLSGWVQTTPTVGTDRTVTVRLGDTTVTIPEFGNTPLSDLSVTFSAQTAYTTSTITCVDGGSNTVGGPQSANTYSANDLKTGTYTCTVVIADP